MSEENMSINLQEFETNLADREFANANVILKKFESKVSGNIYLAEARARYFFVQNQNETAIKHYRQALVLINQIGYLGKQYAAE